MNAREIQPPKPRTIMGITIVVDPNQDPRTITLKNDSGQTVGKIISIGSTPVALEREALIQRLLAMPAGSAQAYDKILGHVWIEDNIRAALDPQEGPHGEV